MRIADVLRIKGSMVATVSPETTVRELLARLAEHNVGALVVIGTDDAVEGIISERDVVRGLHEHGPELLNGPVRRVMTPLVATCTPEDSVDELRHVIDRKRHV